MHRLCIPCRFAAQNKAVSAKVPAWPTDQIKGGYNKKEVWNLTVSDFSLAAGEGFEPSHTESESAVLPLHKPAISVCRSVVNRSEQILLYRRIWICQGIFWKKSKNFGRYCFSWKLWVFRSPSPRTTRQITRKRRLFRRRFFARDKNDKSFN